MTNDNGNDETGEASEAPRAAAVEAVSSERALHEVERRLGGSWPAEQWCDTNVVLAVSGGADSMALLRAVRAVKERRGGAGRLTVAHLNHGMRGGEADRDAAWLADTCRRRRLEVQIGKADIAAAAAEQGDGWEAAARKIRYDFLRGVADRVGARWLVTAHTADDQVETVVHRILRGTGLSGLAGMRTHRPVAPGVTLMRPLLGLWKRELVDYLKVLGQDFRNDSTNNDPRFTRSKIRHGLLPLTRELFNQDVDGALLRLAGQALEAQTIVEQLAERLAERCMKDSRADNPRQSRGLPTDSISGHTQLVIGCDQLAGEPEIVVREMFRRAWRNLGWPEQAMRYDDWELLARMVAALDTPTSANLPGNVLVRRDGTLLVLERRELS
jgi:tRNA(Ile)-lysidine synthase